MKPRKSNVTFSDDAALEYIMALENPHKVGWDSKNRVWRTPKKKGYDKNQIAYGLDIRQDHNPVVYNFLKEKGRLKDPWLTEGEATNLMAQLYAAKNSSVNKAVEKMGGNISQRGYNVLRGMAWHGHPMKQLLNPDSITGKAFLRAIANGDQDLNSVFDAYYGYGSNATQFADRIKADARQRGSIIMETLGDGNKRMRFLPVAQWEPQPLPKPIPETQYPLSGSQAPESLSSWNAALSPSATPTIPSIQKLNNERNAAIQGAFLLPEVTVLGNRRTSLLPKMPSLNDALMAYSPLNQLNRQLSQSLGLNEFLNDLDVTSDLFKFKNGKPPRYKDGTRYIPNDRGGWDRITDDPAADVFADFVVIPSGNKNEKVVNRPGAYDLKLRERLHNAGYVTDEMLETEQRLNEAMNLRGRGENGLEQVSPEFDLLTGIRALMPTINSLDRKTYHVAREMNKGLKKNPILKSYNSNPSYLDTGGNVLQYLDYINSLFPNSKVKGIVYHSTWAKPFEQFDPGKIKRGYGFYFSPNEHHLPFDRIVYSRVNILNPLEIFPNKNRNLDVSGLWRKDITELAIKNGLHDGVIGVSNMRNPGEPEIVALNPEQVHILGSRSDIDGFRKFIVKFRQNK